MSAGARVEPSNLRRWLRLIGLALAAVAIIAAVLVLKEYVWKIPRSVRRTAAEWFLHALLAAHSLVLIVAPLGTMVLTALLVRARRRRERRPMLARALLLGVACLFGLGLVESAAAVQRAWTQRLPALPEALAEKPARPRPEALPDLPLEFKKGPGRDRETVEIVVLGESSANGEPYGDFDPPHAPWLSVGQIVSWQLQRVIPEKQFHTTILAVGGNTLEAQHKRLAEITRRPDVVIVYAGHNEFHSRFNWQRIVPPEVPSDDESAGALVGRAFSLTTPLGRMIREAIARNGVEVAPPSRVTRRLVDWPVCTAEERKEIRADFERRLGAIVAYCERVHALPILIIPPGNDAGYEPNRSVGVGRLSKDDVDALTRQFESARVLERNQPAQALGFYRTFLEQQPKFAEAHYRIARLLERSGEYEAANREFILARDLDGFPQRFPSDFEEAYRTVAARHASAILVEGPTVLRAMSGHGILDDNLFHDAQHPVLIGHVALAQAVLDGMSSRKALGWPAGQETPRIGAVDCAEHFGINADRWAIVCDRVVFFYKRTAYLRHDPAHRLEILDDYERAARQIRAGTKPEDTGIRGLGAAPIWKD
jgi:tetratricopeptide (TPR) repeat protein